VFYTFSYLSSFEYIPILHKDSSWEVASIAVAMATSSSIYTADVDSKVECENLLVINDDR